MKRRYLFLIAVVALLLPSMAHAQALLPPPNGMTAGCTWTVTTFGGAAAQTGNAACLAGYSHIVVVGQNSGGTPTAVVTPAQAATTPQLNVNCAITAAGSTTVGCLAPAGQSTTIVYGFAF